MLCWCLLYNSLNLKIQLLSHVQLFATSWTEAYQASLSSTISWSLLNFMSIESVRPSQPSHSCFATPFSFYLLSLPASRSFPKSHIRWPKYQSFSISPSNIRYSCWFPLGLTGLISLQSKELSRISCIYTYIPSPPRPLTPTSHSSRWSRISLCYIAASHYPSILHMVVWKTF